MGQLVTADEKVNQKGFGGKIFDNCFKTKLKAVHKRSTTLSSKGWKRGEDPRLRLGRGDHLRGKTSRENGG